MFKRIVRKDGSVILLVPKSDTKAVTFEVLYKVGSRQENAKNNGVSHFVEHLMFKGTKRRPNTANIARELDGIGAEYNAFTGKDHTGYYIKADNRHLVLATDMLGDMLNNSKFDKAEVDRERGVIVEEINMYEDNPLMYIEDVFEDLLYQGTVLGRSIAGPRINIQTISRDALYNYYQKHYYNGNAVFGVSGNFEESKVLTLIDQMFPVIKKKIRNKNIAVKVAKQSAPRVGLIKRELEQVQLMLGFRGPGKKDKDYLASQVLANVLGGTMSSRLFLNIRERKGLCYFIRVASQGYEDISSFSVHAGLNTLKTYEALEAIKKELLKVKANGITASELKKTKDNIRGRMVLHLEDSTTELNYLADQELLGVKIKDLDAKLAELDKLTLTEVNAMAKKLIDFKSANLSIIGPFADNKKFINILSA